MELKQMLVLRSDLKMGKGKLVAQGAHASVEAYGKALRKNQDWAEAWQERGSAKVAVKVSSEKELVELFEQAKAKGIPSVLIRDAGRTQLEPGTLTALGLGPAPGNLLDPLTAKLKLL